ncbi:TPA: YgiW/YdeI family stress tolerance OB fold protein [Escherichia coli]|nr:YgiW/YdeI family stress tolerance OB fold protein [Escherichia coli]HAX1982194.1 NirD/YgiW/YdeI family stress tolerance protein [Escherichia coli]HBN7238070.1 YgiW/YdeI family stress tolerance OB fold protein [Escherichia coli]HBN7443576.1 YgiW/YdeI family stress tolerance OB fold protein [Escherichia coli]HDW3968754.1 YgiW/YdeI family stress tolerance OB fold protein [Escherichia coli]
MKKVLIAACFSCVSFGVFAQQGGFQGAEVGRSTVAKAKDMRDEAWVVLEGNIVKKVGDERYEFRDSTGTIVTDIDDSVWAGQNVSLKDKVRLEGEIDKDLTTVEVDVKTLKLLN